MKLNRSLSNKIPDIKALRSLTRLLGKLHVPSCYYTYEDTAYEYSEETGKLINTYQVKKEAYGFGLKESKDFVEGWFEYDQQLTRPNDDDDAPWMPYPRD